jgi:hypothetical protein
MSDEVTFDPIVHELSLGVTPEEAFDLYVRRIGEWWSPVYTANPETVTDVTIEPWIGGRIYTTLSDMGELDWGIVQVCMPPDQLVHSFWLAHPRTYPSLVSIEFAARDDDGTTLRLVHGGWGPGNVEHRHKYGDWGVLLAGYADLVASLN